MALVCFGLLAGLALASVFQPEAPQCSKPSIPPQWALWRPLPSLQAASTLRVVVSPWAHVEVDGSEVGITPMAEKIELSPGRHMVLFRHPQAPPVYKEIELQPGQDLFLDINMDVTRSVELDAVAPPEQLDDSP